MTTAIRLGECEGPSLSLPGGGGAVSANCARRRRAAIRFRMPVLPGRAAARHGAAWVIPPRPWLHGKRGETTPAADLAGRANLWLRAGKPASSEQIGQGNVRTTYRPGNRGQDDGDGRLGRPRRAPGSVAPDPPGRSGDELRDPAGRRGPGALER